MSLLVISEIFGLFVHKFTADGKYSLRNGENLAKPIQMQLPKKQKIFSQYFAAFWKTKSNF